MATQTSRGLLCAFVLAASAAATAAGGRVTGVVTRVDARSLQIQTTARGTTTVTLDDHTGYMKWITHKPRQQSNRATMRSVVPGSCVDVELKDGRDRVARTVRVSADDAGTFTDPCKAIR
jgi:hypothetical protein